MSDTSAWPFPVIRPVWPVALPQLRAFTTLREGGFSCGAFGDAAGAGGMNLATHVGDDTEQVLQNRARLNAVLPQPVIFPSQVHGNMVMHVDQLQPDSVCDAVFADRAGLVCGIQTADCLPVLFAALDAPVVAAAHAGWRGLAGGVLQNTVAAMRQVGAGQICAWLGPAIGAQQFEVGQDVFDQFVAQHPLAANCFKQIKLQPQVKYLADIYALARLVLQQADVQQVSGGDYCTVTDSSRFYSYRRDRQTGRMASLIWLQD